MTLDVFNELDEIKQAETLLNYGVLVAERIYKDFTIFLYQINLFYVEVFYNNNFCMIQGFRGFAEISDIEPYLEEIDITALQGC